MKKDKLILLLTSLLIIYKTLTIILEVSLSNYNLILSLVLLIIIFIFILNDKNNILIKKLKQGPRHSINKIRRTRKLKNFETYASKTLLIALFVYCLLGLFLGFSVKEIIITDFLLILLIGLEEEVLRSLLINSKNKKITNILIFITLTLLMITDTNITLIIVLNLLLTILSYYSRKYLNIIVRIIGIILINLGSLKISYLLNNIILVVLITFIIINLGNFIVSYENIKKRLLYLKITNGIYLVFLLLFLSFILGFFKYKPLAIMSNSMVPTFRAGDMVIYEKTNNLENIEIGDIILYKKENIIIVHRVLEKDIDSLGNYLITKGDNLDNYDKIKIRDKELIGIVKEIIPKAGYPAYVLKNIFS